MSNTAMYRYNEHSQRDIVTGSYTMDSDYFGFNLESNPFFFNTSNIGRTW